MIRIFAYEPNTDDWKKWRQLCLSKQEEHNKKIERGENVQANPRVYGRMKESFYLEKNGPFHGKCAFCEEYIRSSQHGDIEHFRPKGAITDINNSPIFLPSGKKHLGYYWLAFDWSNLLPSCQLCNQPSKGRSEGRRIGKWNAFPLLFEHQRATSPGEECNEEPLLINPALEDPSIDLGIDETGVMYAVAGSLRGHACINIFGLNERDLPGRRRKTILDTNRLVKDFIAAMLDQSDSTERLSCELEDVKNGSVEYAFAARWAFNKSAEVLQTCPQLKPIAG